LGRHREPTPNIHAILENELERLKSIAKAGYHLKVKWVPDASKELSGEVKDGTIIVYDHDENEALKTLRHEFLDACLSELIEPYKEVTNKLISIVNQIAYKRKERLIETLSMTFEK